MEPFDVEFESGPIGITFVTDEDTRGSTKYVYAACGAAGYYGSRASAKSYALPTCAPKPIGQLVDVKWMKHLTCTPGMSSAWPPAARPRAMPSCCGLGRCCWQWRAAWLPTYRSTMFSVRHAVELLDFSWRQQIPGYC